jgi:hypothetical protein
MNNQCIQQLLDNVQESLIMRIVTKQEYETFALLLQEINKKSKQFERQSVRAFTKLHIMSLIGSPEKAAAEATATIERLKSTFELLLQPFEKSAMTCLGIRRGKQESLHSFVERVAFMPEQQLVQTILKNNLRWES